MREVEVLEVESFAVVITALIDKPSFTLYAVLIVLLPPP